jgi:hypothetical protein
MKPKQSVAKLVSPPEHHVSKAEPGQFFLNRRAKHYVFDATPFADAATEIRELIKNFELCLYPPADADPGECYRLAWEVLPGKCDEIAPHLEAVGIDSQPLLEIGRLLGSFPQKLSELDSQWPKVSGLLKRGAILLDGGDRNRGKPDPADAVALTPHEEAFFEALCGLDAPQTGPDIVAKLSRQAIVISESQISRMWRLPQLESRGVRHRKGAGYYVCKTQDNCKATAR